YPWRTRLLRYTTLFRSPGDAPMLEALAAATVLASGWRGQGVFLNPMCGSGTVAIEAAMIATNRYPGLFRDHYSFMHFIGYDATRSEEHTSELQSREKIV